jgi:hypothetical protein
LVERHKRLVPVRGRRARREHGDRQPPGNGLDGLMV